MILIPIAGDRIQISKAGFGVDTIDQFSFLVGTLQFKGVDIALIQHDGQTYNTFANLADIIQLVDEPTWQNQIISETPANSQTVYSSVLSNVDSSLITEANFLII